MSQDQRHKRARARRTPSATKRAKIVSPAKKMLSLSAACSLFRVPGSGNPPSRGLLLYHVSTGKLAPDWKAELPGQTNYGFKRATLQAFARSMGWKYVSRSADA